MNKDQLKESPWIQTEIDFIKNKIEELTKEDRDMDKVFYQGMLQAYENMKNRKITNEANQIK